MQHRMSETSIQDRVVTMLIFGFFSLWVAIAHAQTATLESSADDGRPVDTIIRQIERLSGIPINYEDLLYSNPADTKDVGALVAPARGASAHLIVPRGGKLSISVPVDATNQRLADPTSTANALNALVAAANTSPVIAGRFKLQSYNNTFLVVPTQARSATNDAMSPVTAVRSTPIDLPGVQKTAIDTLRDILEQVFKKTGVEIKIGTIPVKPFMVAKVTIAASNEPASYALIRLFNAIGIAGGASPYLTGMSYHLYRDPVARYFALNISVVQDPNPPKTQPAPQPAPQAMPSLLGNPKEP
jgi:hypothetical protein